MNRKLRRKPRSREQLLPLPALAARQLSMSHHSALALFRSGHGTLEHLAALARVIYMSRLMLCAERPNVTDVEQSRAAEATLHECLIRSQGKENWQLYPDEATQLAPLLTLHDEQLATYRGERYHDAWYRLTAAVEAEISPLACSDAPPADSAFFALLVSRLTEEAGLGLA